ncbi:Uncharacterized protein APZ42_013298 [Daphnia magna]|uniref:Uncharacterized protein n=2 Tax=Daphnia magna TaxID=35525 RepID=A0ABR0AHN8_9CRUS|nr:hypothetical protein OUZ56_010054 [Daphnia magna]KZS20107.1 Uncharacterized protein APZ42_013298 [Daphnia magna]
MLWTNRRAGIKFQASICRRWMKINHITTDFFGQQIIVPETVALETSLTEYTIMAETKRCNDVQMNLTDDKWTYTTDPSTIGSWFSTVSLYVINCMMEETRLIRQGEDDIIETPLGKAKFSDGIHTHNHLTIIWDITVAAAFDNTPRLKADASQLPVAIKTNHLVIGDEHLFFSIPHLDDDSEESDYEPPQRETTTLSNTSKNNTVTALEQILNTQVGSAAHVQFVRDKLTEQENDILRIVRNTQCELVRTKRALATSAAQYDGWLAASILQLPECMNLQAQGETVLLKQCRAIRITFATETTSCGPQPRFKIFTIATNGWELAPYSPCYWRDHFVNFNGRHHVYRNGTWKKAEATLLQPERDLPTSFRYDDDNTHDYEPQANPAYDGITTSHMNIIADLAAAMTEQSMKTGINSSTAMRNIIVTAEEKTGITSYMSWWETFKIIMFFIGLAIISTIAFKILRWFGVFKMIWSCCCTLKNLNKTNHRRNRLREVMDISEAIDMKQYLPPLLQSQV